jgi:hypothetical protein
MCLDRGSEPPLVDFDEFHIGSNINPFRSCCDMSHVDMRTDGLLLGPVEMRVDHFDRRPFKEPNKETGCENLGHCLEFIRLGIERRYGF